MMQPWWVPRALDDSPLHYIKIVFHNQPSFTDTPLLGILYILFMYVWTLLFMHMVFREDVYKYIILSIADFFLTPQVMMKSFWHKINYRHLEIKKKLLFLWLPQHPSNKLERKQVEKVKSRKCVSLKISLDSDTSWLHV